MRRKFISQKELGYILIVALVVLEGGITYNNFTKVGTMKINTTSVYINRVNSINDLLRQSEQIKNTKKVAKVKEKPNYDIPLAKEYSDLIWELSEKNNLSYELALAVMYQESKFDANMINVNRNGSHDGGLYQLNNRSIKDFKKYAIEYCGLSENESIDVLDPKDNIILGIGNLVHLRNYYQEKGVNDEDIIFYVAGAFNQGKDGFKGYVSRNGYLETSYANKVLYYKTRLEQKGTLE